MTRHMVLGKDLEIAALPKGLEALALYTVQKKDLKRLDGLEALPLRTLELRWVSVPDFTHLPLPATLEEIYVWHSPKLKSCDGIEQAKRLRRFRWWDTGRLEDGTALRNLPELRVLEIEGGMNSKQKLCGLEFLRGLVLDRLVLNGIAPADMDIAPILEMESLQSFVAHGPDWEIDSLAALCARFPALYESIVAMEDYPPDLGMKCRKCGGGQQTLWLRKRKFLWCRACDEAGLQRVLGEFAGRVEAARQAQGAGVSGGDSSKGAVK